MAAAGPSRPRQPSQSSLPAPAPSRDYRNTTPGTSVFDADAYDDDPDSLPGYSSPKARKASIGDAVVDGRRYSGERLLRSGERIRSQGVGDPGPPGDAARERTEDEEGEMQVMGMGMGVAQRKAAWLRNTLITGLFVCGWYGSATLLSIYNKWMFSAEYYNFPYPLFVTSCHMVVQGTLAALVRNIWRDRYRPVERPSRQDYVAKIFPTALSTAGDIGLSNLSLRTITLSLYTMCKSSVLIFVLLFAFLFQLERFSLHLVGVITLISAGVFLMVFDTTSVNIPGIIMVFSASALSGLRWALTETIMKKKSMGLSNPFATIFWLAPLMAVILTPVSLGVEGWQNVFGSGHFDQGSVLITTLVILFPGAIAFAMVTTEYFIIQRAGILPLSVAGVFKEVTTISISAWIFGDQLTELNIVGVAVAVSGIALYSYHKYNKAMSNSSSEEDSPLILPPGANPNQYSLASSSDPDAHGEAFLPGSVPMSQLPSASSRDRDHVYPPAVQKEPNGAEEDPEAVAQKRRDDFEGWNEDWSDGDDDAEPEEDEDEEVLKRRKERVGEEGKGRDQGESWGEWWDKDM